MKRSKIWASAHPFLEGGAVLGRRVANSSFLAALLKADPYAEYHFFLNHPDACKAQEEALERSFPELWARGGVKVALQRTLPRALRERDYHVFHLSDPFALYCELIRARNAYSRVIFPVTAPTHSLSYREYGPEFLRHLWPGVSRRDAVLATSRAGEAVVGNVYRALRQNYRLSENEFPAPVIRRIPLGVDPAAMPAPEERGALGAKERSVLGLGAEVIFLVFARISYQSKMDLLPLLRAFKRAEAGGLAGTPYALVLAGWLDEDDDFGAKLEALAANLGINCRLVARPDDSRRRSLFAAADVFVSPSDNLQETFGLTLVEAALASLPVIASDFDGYRDLVAHGETGFLIPTLGPSSTPGTDVIAGLTPASEYHLRLAEQCVVELGALAEALVLLGANAGLRAAMGACGRERALAAYAWDKIISRYAALWDELAGMPLGPGEEERLRAAVEPALPPYMEIFGHYFTRNVDDAVSRGALVRMSAAGEAVYRGLDFPVVYAMIEDDIDLEVLRKLLFSARKPVPLSRLLRASSGEAGPEDAGFLPLWALKHDLLELI